MKNIVQCLWQVYVTTAYIYLPTLCITASGYTTVTVAHNLFIRSQCKMKYGARVIYNKQSRLSFLAVNTARIYAMYGHHKRLYTLHVTKHKSCAF